MTKNQETDQYCTLAELISRIDQMAERPLIIAIDGRSGSGKSMLGQILQEKYEARLFHMDDFFLQPYQKTKERIEEIGGNVDYERFKSEIVDNLLKEEPISYQIYDCRAEALTERKTARYAPVAVVEGSYSCHPYFGSYAGLRIFLDVEDEEQMRRIMVRNGPVMAKRFQNEWIPKEDAYFEKYKIRENSHVIMENW